MTDKTGQDMHYAEFAEDEVSFVAISMPRQTNADL